MGGYVTTNNNIQSSSGWDIYLFKDLPGWLQCHFSQKMSP